MSDYDPTDVSMLDPAYLGPDGDLLERQGKLGYAPISAELTDDEKAALIERIIAVRSLGDLDPADQALIELGCLQVDAGLADSFKSHDDWAVEDAALDALDGIDEKAVLAAFRSREAKAAPAPDDGEDWVGL